MNQPGVPAMVIGQVSWTRVIAAAAIAAVAAWLLGESGLTRVEPAKADVMLMGLKRLDVTPETVHSAELRTALVEFTAFGAVLGLGTGAAAGWGTPARRGRMAALVGLVSGAAAGAVATAVVLPAYHRMVADGVAETLSSLAGHAGIWVPIGAAAGLAVGTGAGGRGRILRAVAAGAIGSLLGSAVFEVVGALAFPLDMTNQPISKGVISRLVARLLAAVPAAAASLVAVNIRGAVAPSPATDTDSVAS